MLEIDSLKLVGNVWRDVTRLIDSTVIIRPQKIFGDTVLSVPVRVDKIL